MSYTLTLHHRLVRREACWLLFQSGSYSIIFLQNLSHYTYIARPPTRCRIVDPSFSPCCFSRPQVLVCDFQMNGVLHPQDQYFTLGHFSLHSNAFEHSEKSTIHSQLWKAEQSLGDSASSSYDFQWRIYNDRYLNKTLRISSQIKFSLMGQLCFPTLNTLQKICLRDNSQSSLPIYKLDIYVHGDLSIYL